jgi:hypothetical protein
MQQRRGGSRQRELFARSMEPVIPIEPTHPLVLLADELDWTTVVERVEVVREKKLKSAAGRPPHLRAQIGAMLLKATRDMTWRQTEDPIRHYAPARYLCGLTETDWTPDFTTLHDFAQLLGEDGVALINELTVRWAIKEKLASPTVAVADTTAQEAAIGHRPSQRDGADGELRGLGGAGEPSRGPCAGFFGATRGQGAQVDRQEGLGLIRP